MFATVSPFFFEMAEAGAAGATERPAPAIAIAMYFLPFRMIILRRKTFHAVCVHRQR